MSEDRIGDLLRKIKEYPVGRETSYVMGPGQIRFHWPAASRTSNQR